MQSEKLSALLYQLKESLIPHSFKEFFLPRFTVGYFIRIAILIIFCVVFFGIFFTPVVIRGGSMEPTYAKLGANLVNRFRFKFRELQRGDIVVIHYADKVMYLKRIVGLPGETVEFRNGKLLINGTEFIEPYVKYPCNWNLPPRKVDDNYYYVVGDNRSQPQQQHRFGQVSRRRIIGAPLW